MSRDFSVAGSSYSYGSGLWSSAQPPVSRRQPIGRSRLLSGSVVALTALGAAVLIGIGDFFGSLAARQGRILAATLWVMILAAFPTVVVALIIGGSPRPIDYWLGGIAGLAGGAGLLMLYAGYAKTSIGIVGPVTAVTGVVLPVSVGITIGDKVGGAAVLGIGMGILAVVLIGWKPETGGRHTAMAGVLYGLGAGAGFGIMATMLGLTPESAGLLPVIPTRVVNALLLVVIAMSRKLPIMPKLRSWRLIPLAATGSAGGVLLFTIAAQQNLTISGLLLQMAYGVSTLLAIVFLGERSSITQRLGFVAATVAIALMILG